MEERGVRRVEAGDIYADVGRRKIIDGDCCPASLPSLNLD